MLKEMLTRSVSGACFRGAAGRGCLAGINKTHTHFGCAPQDTTNESRSA
jgi:hypothetical protein